MTGFINTYAEPGAQLQNTFDAAVVIPTILRPELGDALRSVFAQDLGGRIHALIGIATCNIPFDAGRNMRGAAAQLSGTDVLPRIFDGSSK